LRRGDRYLNGLFVVLVNIPRLVNESPSSLSESEGVVVVVVSSSLYPYTSPLSLSAQASQTVWVSIRIFIIHDSYVIYPL